MKTLIALTLIAATAGCVSAPFPQLRNVSLEVDVSTQVAGSETYFWDGVSYGGGHLGRLAMVLDQPLSRSIAYRLGVEHMSLLDTSHDRGEERAFAGVVWRPFARGGL